MVLRPLPARRARRPEHHGRRLGPAEEPAHRARPASRATSCGTSLDLRPPAGRRSARSRASSRAGPARRARSSRSTRATARCWRWAPTRRSTRASSPSRSRSSATTRSSASRRGSPLFNRAIARRLPDGLDVQADHRAGGARARPDHAGHADQRPGLPQDQPDADAPQRARRGQRRRSACARALQVSSDVFFFTLGRDANGAQGPGDPDAGRASSASAAAPGIDLPGEIKGTIPDRAWRARVARAEEALRAQRKVTSVRDLRQAPVVARRQRQPRRRPGRRAGDAAADGGRLRGDRERRQDRAARTSASRSRTTAAARCSGDQGARGAPREDRPRQPPGGPRRPAHGDDRPGGTSAGVFSDWNQNAFPLFGKTGTASATATATSPGTSPSCQHRTQADRDRDDGRGRRLRRRGGGARRPAGCSPHGTTRRRRCAAAVVKE